MRRRRGERGRGKRKRGRTMWEQIPPRRRAKEKSQGRESEFEREKGKARREGGKAEERSGSVPVPQQGVRNVQKTSACRPAGRCSSETASWKGDRETTRLAVRNRCVIMKGCGRQCTPVYTTTAFSVFVGFFLRVRKGSCMHIGSPRDRNAETRELLCPSLSLLVPALLHLRRGPTLFAEGFVGGVWQEGEERNKIPDCNEVGGAASVAASFLEKSRECDKPVRKTLNDQEITGLKLTSMNIPKSLSV